jgi:DNA (cytosine-5)-methyltransferase 1
MKYLSVCSGIEAATVAWHPLGWQPVGFSEIEAFPSAVLAHHYPDVRNYGDMTKYKEWNLEPIDLLVGGTPCQSFSVAGLRRGLEDPRGNLALTYVGVLDRFRPEWCVWENVPGVLSSNGGRDFGSFLGALAELGYGFAYRVLDAQYFGVAQRRRRVFVVGYLGDWRRATAVLFEPESLRGDPAPSREAAKAITGTIEASINCSRGAGTPTAAMTARMVAFGEYVDDGTASAMKARDYKDATDLVAIPIHDQATQFAGKRGDKHAVAYAAAVRRLTPTECERLQGFADNYTNIPWRKAIDSPDGPRYKSLGNSMAVPVMKWIGERIKLQMPTPAG